MIKFLNNGEIDRKKWDSCIINSRQKLIYSLSWYLDLVAPGWNGLVEDDYMSVMALPTRKKWGIHYLFQPLYTQQLGIYSSSIPDASKIRLFYDAIPAFYKYIQYSFNLYNDLPATKLQYIQRVNYELKLNHNYQKMELAYTENTRRNINKSLPYIELNEKISIPDIIKLKRQNSIGKRNSEFYEWLNCLMEGLISRGNGFLIGARMKDELVAAAFFLNYSGRIYYLVPVSSEKGKSHRAMFAILDYVIGKNADTGMVLDFEGSGIKGIARFFEGFGAKPVNYFSLKENRLPFFLRLLKK